MKKWRLGILVVFIAFCFALVGCGGGGGNGGDAPQDEAQSQDVEPEKDGGAAQPSQADLDAIFAGEWELVAIENPDSDVSEADIQSLKEAGMTVNLVLSDDGSAAMTMFGEDAGSGTWSAVSETECDFTLEGQPIEVTFDPASGRLRLAQGSDIMFFVRSEGASGASGGSSTPASDYDLLDAKGNPTFYSVLELSGDQLVNAIEMVGFEWNDGNKWWVSSDGNDAFYVSSNNDYEYIYSEISALDVCGRGDPCVYVIVVDDRDYSSSEDAFNKLCNVDVTDIMWFDDEFGIAVVEGPSGNQAFVTISYTADPGLYFINIFNEDAAESGLIAEYIGEGYGSTIDELHANLFE